MSSLSDCRTAGVRPRVGRARLPLHYLLEAAARVCFAYMRDQYGFRRRRPLPLYIGRSVAFLLAGRRRRFVEAEMSGLRVVLPTADRTIARSVYAAGDWDPLLVGSVLDALRLFGADVRGSVFLEIGANFGVYALPAVARMGFRRAVAYEPDPASFALLETNIERNGLADRVTAVNAALSDRPGLLTLARSSTNAGDNRIVGADGSLPARRGAVAVRASTVDDDVEAGVIPLDELGLVWLDVQGHEAQVLAGAGRLLAAGVPMVLEYSSGMMGPDARGRLDDQIIGSYDTLVDLGWSALTNRLFFRPATAIRTLVPPGRPVETDLLLLRRR